MQGIDRLRVQSTSPAKTVDIPYLDDIERVLLVLSNSVIYPVLPLSGAGSSDEVIARLPRGTDDRPLQKQPTNRLAIRAATAHRTSPENLTPASGRIAEGALVAATGLQLEWQLRSITRHRVTGFCCPMAITFATL